MYNHLNKEEIASCFFIVFWMSCYCKCPVGLPRGAVSWSAVCGCGISSSYSLAFEDSLWMQMQSCLILCLVCHLVSE